MAEITTEIFASYRADGVIPSYANFYSNSSPAAKVHRFNDRVFIGGAVKNTGRNAAPYGDTWLSKYGATYWELNATAVILNEEGQGRAALIVGSYTAPGVPANMNMGIGAITVHRGTTGNGRAVYAEAMFYGTSTGVAEGIEVNVGNYSSIDPAQPTPYNASGGTGGAHGMSIGAESGYNYNQGDADTPITTPTYAAAAALRINGGGLSASYQRFRQGLMFAQDALFRGSDGLNGNAHAIALATGHQVEWYSAHTVRNATIRSDAISVANQDVSIIFNNNQIAINGASETKIASFNHVVNAVNYAKIANAASGSFPAISFEGSDTNVGAFFQTKGSGQARFLSHAGSGLNLYILPPATAPVNPVTIGGGTTGNSPTISVAGETNVGLALLPKGTGSVTLRGGAGAVKLAVDDNGIAFYGGTPIAKQALPSALSTGGAETNSNITTAINGIRTVLSNLGLGS